MNQETINEAELDRRFRQVLKEIFSGRFEDTEAKGKRRRPDEEDIREIANSLSITVV